MDLRKQLIDGDPVAHEPELSARHTQAMRQRVLLEARTQQATTEREGLSRAFGLAAALAACLIAGVTIGLRMNERQPIAPAPASQHVVRQLQFSTPGGTRIIWTFHQEFEL